MMAVSQSPERLSCFTNEMALVRYSRTLRFWLSAVSLLGFSGRLFIWLAMWPSRALKFVPFAALRFVRLCVRDDAGLCCPACKLNCDDDGGYSREEVSGPVREDCDGLRLMVSALLRKFWLLLVK